MSPQDAKRFVDRRIKNRSEYPMTYNTKGTVQLSRSWTDVKWEAGEHGATPGWHFRDPHSASCDYVSTRWMSDKSKASFREKKKRAEAKRRERQLETAHQDEQDPPSASTRDTSSASSARELGEGKEPQKAPPKEQQKEQQKEETWRYAAHSGDKAGWVTCLVGLWTVFCCSCQGKQPSLDEYEWVPCSPEEDEMKRQEQE
ncbi:unnamed protein product [Vitrella brassicaformis CCMP3155]|uniref:Uncharacterized protein n=1 Tax=Vitrella brassicaformis (strain CCMP3155) TaxID=1169540 RepID=A0A0G4H7J4_VITBC|nr:unnamed protein product [Vitrella brassicaformis CCMP3155]|eukprot:CEM39838.1 unnamed protein product [Vitrella brassicaformis CCMP3155]